MMEKNNSSCNVNYATFWHGGPLSPYELACFQSFSQLGQNLSVYSYHPVQNLPATVHAKPASDILSPDLLNAFIVKGVPSLAHFSDLFRLALFGKTDEIWVDTDIVLLQPLALDPSSNIIGLEEEGSLCNAVLHLDKNDPRLQICIDTVTAMAGKDIKWGATGPALLTEIYGFTEAQPEKVFYPLHFNEYWKFLLPRFRDECVALCRTATTLHLWNHLVAEMGYYKNVGPPKGSYLYELFERYDALRFFADFYPVKAVEFMTYNVVERPGDDAGFMRILKLLPHAAKVTYLRRTGKL